MTNFHFSRNSGKDDRPVLAICYDFDKTLSPKDMQTWGYIQEVRGCNEADYSAGRKWKPMPRK